MHLNKILEQIKRHQSPTEAIEMREMQNKIDTLRDEKNALQSSALLQQQTSNIVSQIRPCPVPAYLTCNPYGCNGGLNGYGYGYPYGYGDSCCA